MMNGNDYLYKKIPQIRRARDYHLYDFHGRRYLDCFLDGGRALLGHKPGRTVLMMKNSLEKGLTAAYPGIYLQRLLKQLKLLYPMISGCAVVYASASSDSGINLFRPFDAAEPPHDAPFELILPMPGSGLIRVLCAAENCIDALPGSDPVPQYLLSGLCRAAAELSVFRDSADQKTWTAFDSPLWRRNGPWLYPLTEAARYEQLFTLFLDLGILLSPYREIPSCVPYRFTEGEIKPIKKIEGEFC